jgi:hypothetical protein
MGFQCSSRLWAEPNVIGRQEKVMASTHASTGNRYGEQGEKKHGLERQPRINTRKELKVFGQTRLSD